METSYYVEAVKNQVTGFGILESELDDNGYKNIIKTALRELNRYYNVLSYKSISCSGSCIDLSEHRDIKYITNVFRENGVGNGNPDKKNEADPVYMSQLQMYNFGSGYYSTDYIRRLASFSLNQRISNTLSTDLEFREDRQQQKLYVNFPQGIPSSITVEYIPMLRDPNQLVGEYWEDIYIRLCVAYSKIALGRIRTRFTQQNAIWSNDGTTLLEEGTTELNDLREKLRTATDYLLPVD